MSKLADDERFKNVDPLVANIANDITDAKLKLNENEEGKVDMCVALQELRVDWLNEGRNEGILEGRNEGKIEGKKEGILENTIAVAKKMLSKNKLSIEDISDYSGLSVEKVKELAKEVNNN